MTQRPPGQDPTEISTETINRSLVERAGPKSATLVARFGVLSAAVLSLGLVASTGCGPDFGDDEDPDRTLVLTNSPVETPSTSEIAVVGTVDSTSTGDDPTGVDPPDNSNSDTSDSEVPESEDIACEIGTPPAACYDGPPGTEGVGICKGGMKTCSGVGFWNPCVGGTIPANELCGNLIDDDCNGEVDEVIDFDDDGFAACDGDCNDNDALINPGSYDGVGNGVDDDCDGKPDSLLVGCDENLIDGNKGADDDYAKAMDICQFTEQKYTGQNRTWGVMDVVFTNASGKDDADRDGRSVRRNFGTSIWTEEGKRLTVLSTSRAADRFDDDNPAFKSISYDLDDGKDGTELPSDYDSIPDVPGCDSATTIADSTSMDMSIRVPTNAKSFSVKVNFLSHEYPEFVCTQYNDFFVALLDSKAEGNPSDKNIAFYKDEDGAKWPMGVNILKAADELFTICENEKIGCGENAVDDPTGEYEGCLGGEMLEGTGFEVEDEVCGSSDGKSGGGTGWLKLSGNVLPGEDIRLRFIIWDTGDSGWDSTVLIDDFEWSTNETIVGIVPK